MHIEYLSKPGHREGRRSSTRWTRALATLSLLACTAPASVASGVELAASGWVEARPVSALGGRLVRPGGADYLSAGLTSARPGRDVVDTVSADPRLETFVAALQIAGLAELMRSAEQVLVFAPINEAFDRLDEGERHALFSDREALMRLLSRHVRFAGLDVGRRGSEVPVGLRAGAAARVVGLDRSARNGVVHIIDSLIRVN